VLPDPNETPVLTVAAVANLLGVGINQAYDGVKRGEIPAIRLGRRILVPVAPLRRQLGLDANSPADPPAATSGGVVELPARPRRRSDRAVRIEPRKSRPTPPGPLSTA
jgi:excisionase family DNA binding protein